MKYFTPELHLQAQMVGSPAVAEQAMADADQAEQAYEAHLKHFWSRLPTGVREYLDRVRLHDATVLGMDGQGDRGAFRILLREDRPSLSHVELEYDVADRPTWFPSILPLEHRGPSDAWMYDEITVEVPIVSSQQPVFVHSILFADGRELTVRFHDLRVYRFAPMLTTASA